VVVDKGSYRWTFRNLHNRIGIGEEKESGNKFQKNKILNKVLGQKTFDLNWCILPRITYLFIAEIHSQLG